MFLAVLFVGMHTVLWLQGQVMSAEPCTLEATACPLEKLGMYPSLLGKDICLHTAVH